MDSSPKETPLATYKQIAVSLRTRIHEGQWTVGAMLPSRRDLAREYGVSPITIERAITHLIADGVLRADDRRGTFVASAGTGAVAAPAAPPVARRGPATAVIDTPPITPRYAVTPATIGIIASLYLYNHDHLELNNFWVGQMVHSLEQGVSEYGNTTRFFNRIQEPGHPPISLGVTIQALIDEGVDAIAVIAFGMDTEELDTALAIGMEHPLPIVCITAGPLRRPVPHIFLDNHSAGYETARHLLRNGCRDLLFLAPFTAAWMQERLAGVRAAVEDAHLPATAVRLYPPTDKPWVQEEDPQALGYAAASAFFAAGSLPTGVVCVNDGVAFGFLQAAQERGLTAGKDFAIVSFDDHPEARGQQLTSMRPPMEAMGQEAARLLLRALQGEQVSLQIRLRWHLIPRASSRTPHSVWKV